jgi:DNA polymerase-3 subunit delta'
MWMAARVNCESPRSCGEARCPACEKAGRLEHPDIHIVYPLPSGQPEKTIPEIMDSRRGDFMAAGEFGGKARSIGIGQVRAMIEEASKQPFEGKRSVVILSEAHMATIEAQNAFLKLLEEPPPSTSLILVTDHPDRLLATIRSRCHEVRFDTLSDATVKEFLVVFYSVEESEASRLAALAAGNIRRGIRLLDPRYLGIRADAVSMLKLVLGGKASKLPAEAEAAAKEYTREETGQLLEEMIFLLRATMLDREGCLEPGRKTQLEKELGTHLTVSTAGRNIPRDIRKVERSVRDLARNVDIELTLAQLLLDLAGKWY